ncbi:MAG: hypothetical protein RIQ62_304 [Bacteroidota bacterium]
MRTQHLFRFWVSLFFLLLTIGGLSSFNDSGTIKLWMEKDKLSWADFQGKLDPQVLAENHVKKSEDIVTEEGTRHTETAAYCSHTLSFQSWYENGMITYEVKTLFNKLKSWKNTQSAYILNHEQRHFDLAEVHARMLRQYLKDSVQKFDRQMQNKIMSRFMQLDNEAQADYDAATQHSELIEEQEKYDAYIDDLLKEYADYAEPRFSVKIGK